MSTGSTHIEMRTGVYADSVKLMQVSRAIAAPDGVIARSVAMATPLNIERAAGMGFRLPTSAGPNDLLVAIRASTTPRSLAARRPTLDAALAAPPAGADRHRRRRAAAHHRRRRDRPPGRRPGVISVPGRNAVVEAPDAIAAGRQRAGLLRQRRRSSTRSPSRTPRPRPACCVMGPDCGTAVVGGVGARLRQRRAPGPVGIVAASGTGAQQMICLLDAAGVGVTPLPRRRRTRPVRARSAAAPPGRRSRPSPPTRPPSSIVVVSKPPAPRGAEDGRRRTPPTLGMPVALGHARAGSARPDRRRRGGAVRGRRPAHRSGRAGRAGRPRARCPARCGACSPAARSPTRRCSSPAQALGQIRSNIPLSPELALGADLRSDSATWSSTSATTA